MLRPEKSEYDPYYETYVATIDGNEAVSVLDEQVDVLRGLLSHLPEERGSYAYDTGKWTIKEVMSHLIDAERMFAYRMFRISRGDETPIEGFEQDGYIENSNANNRSFAELLDEFELQRRSNLMMIENIGELGGERVGTANNRPVSVRALVYVMAGHVRHHIGILETRYLS